MVGYDAVDKWSTAETVNMYLRRKAIRTGMKGALELGIAFALITGTRHGRIDVLIEPGVYAEYPGKTPS